MLSTVPFQSMAGLDAPVGDVMHPGFYSVPADATLADVATVMRDRKVHAVLVTGLNSAPLGWVTSRGILHNHAREWSAATRAADAITESAARVPATATLSDALTAFVASGTSHLLVGAPDGEAPIGVIADSDLVALMAR